MPPPCCAHPCCILCAVPLPGPNPALPGLAGSFQGRKSRSAKVSSGCTCASHPQPRWPQDDRVATASLSSFRTAGEGAFRPGVLGQGREGGMQALRFLRALPAPLCLQRPPPLCCADKEGLLQLPFRAGQAWEGPGAQVGQAAAAAAAGQEGASSEHGAAQHQGEGAAGEGPHSGMLPRVGPPCPTLCGHSGGVGGTETTTHTRAPTSLGRRWCRMQAALTRATAASAARPAPTTSAAPTPAARTGEGQPPEVGRKGKRSGPRQP